MRKDIQYIKKNIDYICRTFENRCCEIEKKVDWLETKIWFFIGIGAGISFLSGLVFKIIGLW